MHTCRRLLGDTLDARRDLGPAGGGLGERAPQGLEHHAVLLRGRLVGHRHDAGELELAALVDEQGGVAAVVKNHVGSKAIGPHENLLGAPPVLVEALALPRVDRHTLRILGSSIGAYGHSSSSMILRGKDVARCPAHLGAKLDQRLDENSRLDGHVE